MVEVSKCIVHNACMYMSVPVQEYSWFYLGFVLRSFDSALRNAQVLLLTYLECVLLLVVCQGYRYGGDDDGC